jgi:mono/diheme cytochrome c family protein
MFPEGGRMRLRYRIWILLPVLMVPLMLALGKGDAAKGKTLFSRCAICHGNNGDGNEAIAKALGVKMPVLGSQEVQSLDDAALKKVILEGKGKMKAVNLSNEEVEDVIAFLRGLKKQLPK